MCSTNRLHANAAIALLFHSGIVGAASVSRIVGGNFAPMEVLE